MEKLRFLHIPKTAGSTFKRILLRQYKGAGHFVFKGNNPLDIERFNALSASERKAIKLFTGHAPIVTGIREADEVPIITILRDPVKRVMSFCQHVSEGKSPHLLKYHPPETFNLDEFLESGNSELSNLQSRMLINYERDGQGLLIENLTEQQIVGKSLDNLCSKITCYGLQEYFDQSLVLFARRLAWKTPYYESVNRPNTKQLLKFEERHIDRIKELNTVDIEFYTKAKQRFLSKIENDDEFLRQYNRFRTNQKALSPFIKCYGGLGRYAKRCYRAVFSGAH